MDSPPLPASLADDVLAAWLFDVDVENDASYVHLARAVRALVEAKVREALQATSDEHCYAMWVGQSHIDAIVARVMGAP